MRTRIRERRIGSPGAGKLAVQLDAASHIHHHHERRATFIGGQGAGIVFRLRTCAQHALVIALIVGFLDVLGFQHECAATVKINVAPGFGTVAVAESHPAFEHVGIGAIIRAGRFRCRQFEQCRQLGQEQLIVGALATVGALPACDKGVNACSVVHAVSLWIGRA